MSLPENRLRDLLFPVPEQDYGELYRDHLLTLYAKYTDTVDRTSERRQTANAFFLSINTALVAFLGYTGFRAANATPDPRYFWPVLGVGVILSALWARLIKSYRDLNTGKFRVIHEIEKKLPVSPYRAEWEVLGEGKSRSTYWPFSHLERYVPILFVVLYGALFVLSLIK
jgi:hypothetical protein